MLLFAPNVFADVTVLYRKSDRVVAGWVRSPAQVEVELENIVNSDLGGQVSDYATTTVTDNAWRARAGKLPAVSASGKVTFEPSPREIQKAQVLEGLKQKLGLTDEELDALR